MLLRRLSLASAAFASCLLHAQDGYDSGGYPTELVSRLGLDTAQPRTQALGTWLRLRGFPAAPVRLKDESAPLSPTESEAQAAKIEEVRRALGKLRGGGYRLAAYLRWERVWPSGGRTGDEIGNRAPLDLREAYRRAEAFARTYGDLVDAWEFENEPDIPFFSDNADVFTAYYKAVALGLASGRAEIAQARPAVAGGPPPARSLIVMPALALPPGPYAEQMRNNGFVAYTEGANLHYYGFEEDYADAHARLRELFVADAPPPSPEKALSGFGISKPGASAPAREWVPARSLTRRLPVFVTEWGYPRLDGFEAQTIEGRARQWRYFRDVQMTNERLGVAAPMAFYLPPYYEYKAKEFGLAMPSDERRAAHYGFVIEAKTEVENGPVQFTAGGLTFTPASFGARHEEPWMRRIGERIGNDEASPALAWLMDRAARRASGEISIGAAERSGHFRSPADRVPAGWAGDWRVGAEAPSPVVIDFIAGEHVLSAKTFVGYFLQGHEGRIASGRGKLVFYNFARESSEVEFMVPEALELEGANPSSTGKWKLVLGAGERRELPVTLRVSADRFYPHEVKLSAEARTGATTTRSRWASRLYPSGVGFVAAQERSLRFDANDARHNRAWLLARPQVEEEARLVSDGRWLVTPGVTVEETPEGMWRFHVSAMPGVGMRPAVAELPLPDDWAPWESGLMLSYDFRVSPASAALRTNSRSDEPDETLRSQVGALRDIVSSYLRTRTGALYSTLPRLAADPTWKRYNQPAESLTPGFPGRFAAPMRVDRERPASLAFFFRPAGLPTTYEIANPSLCHFRTETK